MKEAIELWEQMYMNQSPWLTENVKSLNLASLISSEKARTATIEMDVKITGESDMAKFMKDAFQKVELKIREQLEYGIALGGLVIKPYVTLGADGSEIAVVFGVRISERYKLTADTKEVLEVRYCGGNSDGFFEGV